MRTLLLLWIGLAIGCHRSSPTAVLSTPLDPSWGTAIDPDHNCVFQAGGDGLTITLPANDKDLSIERGRMNAPRVLRTVTGDFTATVRVRGTFRPSAFSAAFDRPAFVGAGLILMADEQTYVRLERAGLNSDGRESSYVNWELRLNGQWSKSGNIGEAKLADTNTWFRLSRQGNQIGGEYSQDGTTWTPLVGLTIVGLPADVQVGLSAVTTGTTAFRPTFDGYKVEAVR